MQNSHQKNQEDQFSAFKIKLNTLLRNPYLCGKKAIEIAKLHTPSQKVVETTNNPIDPKTLMS